MHATLEALLIGQIRLGDKELIAVGGGADNAGLAGRPGVETELGFHALE
jgi:hypothetical protein